MTGVIDSFSPGSLFLTQIGKTGVSNLLMRRYVKEASPREITAERRIIYSRSLHTATPSTQPAADGAALRKKKKSHLINKIKERQVSSLVGKTWRKRDLPREMTTEQSGGRPAWSRSGSSRWWEQKYSPLTRRNAVLLPPHVWRHMGLYIAFRPTFFSPFCTLGMRSAHQ